MADIDGDGGDGQPPCNSAPSTSSSTAAAAPVTSIDSGGGVRSYENPNYRKLYAKLNMNAMIGQDNDDESCKLLQPKQESNLEFSAATATTDDQPMNEETKVDDLQFYYGDYEEDEDDEEDEEDEYFEDDIEDYISEEDRSEFGKLQSTNVAGKVKAPSQEKSKQLPQEPLPDGWERHEDELGPYFWHIPTGTIQRQRPFLDTIDKSMIRSDSLVFLDNSIVNVDYNPDPDMNPHDEHDELQTTAEGSTQQTGEQDDENEDAERKSLLVSNKKKVIANLRLTFPNDDETEYTDEDGNSESLNFMVHSLGWVEVDESQVNSQTGSMVIKRCIYQLSHQADSAARCWGPDETQRLVLRLNGDKICLLDPVTDTVLSIQQLREIRMWAVDEKNNFAYVVKDRFGAAAAAGTGATMSPTTTKTTKAANMTTTDNVLKCHVFNCEDDTTTSSIRSPHAAYQSSAQRIAIYLKEALIRIKLRSQLDVSSSSGQQKNGLTRPNKLIIGGNGRSYATEAQRDILTTFEFPTPIEEPRKTISALYIGLVPVNRPMGVDVLNMAIEEIISSLKLSLSDENDETELMRPVQVHISPSNIVVECAETGATLIECRVRYLSFLGISLDNVKRCGFIMQVDERKFVAHCFQAEPSAGALCKTIEAACKLRYQKCLDAHSKLAKHNKNNNNSGYKQGIASTSSINGQAGTNNTSPTVAAIKSTIAGVFSKILKSPRGS